jgi:O-antigen ligase
MDLYDRIINIKLKPFLEYLIVSVFSLFLFTAPYNRKIAKYLIILGFALLVIWRIFMFRPGKAHKGFFFSRTTNSLLLFFLVSCFFSIVLSSNPYHSQKVFLNRFPFFIVLVWCGSILGRSWKKKGLVALVLAFQAAALFMGVGGFWDFIAKFPAQERLWSVWGMPTSFGMLPLYLSFFISFNFAVLLFSHSRYMFDLGIVNLMFLVFFMIWQQCRSAFVAVPASAIFISYFKGKKRFMYFFVVVVVALAVFASLSPRIRGNVRAFTDVRKWSHRLPLYKSAVQIFADHPVWGAGIGTFELLIKDKRYEIPHEYFPNQRSLFIHAHNFYLETLAEMGIMGLCSFLLIFYSFFAALFRRIRTINDRVFKSILIGVGGIMVVSFVFGMSATIITVGIGESGIFWFFFGLGHGLMKREGSYGRNIRQPG